VKRLLWLSGFTAAFAAALLGSAAAGPGKAAPPPSVGRLSLMDARFVHAAALGEMMEIDLGQLAEERAMRADIKAYAARMAKEHAGSNQELRRLAADKGITLPAMLPFPGDRSAKPKAAPGAIADPELAAARTDLARLGLRHMVVKHQETRRMLIALSGEAFDKAFMAQQFIEHTKMAAAFELKSIEAQDADLRKFASKVLPMLHEHRDSARRLTGLGPQMRTAVRR
jgi:putative membrane protein